MLDEIDWLRGKAEAVMGIESCVLAMAGRERRIRGGLHGNERGIDERDDGRSA